MKPRPKSLDAHLAEAAKHINSALLLLEATEHDRYCDAAYDLRITAYGTHCVRKYQLHQLAETLQSLIA